MNAKRCKELRRNLRQQDVDPRDAQYLRTRKGGIVLDHDCGRAVYQAAKKAGAV